MNDAIQAGVRKCRESCGYFGLCGGGAPSNKFAENGRFDSTETLYCRFKKQLLIDVVEDFTISSLVYNRQNRRRPSATASG
jgi:sulfatase maturation enzyme AslB (radical SAM superfamily)